jgi:hypothetical protein
MSRQMQELHYLDSTTRTSRSLTARIEDWVFIGRSRMGPARRVQLSK